MTMQRIAVIGAGIAGLTVALRREQLGDRVTLFEAAAEVGGQLRSEIRDGFVVEHGAEGFVARSEAVPSLASDVGIADALVDQIEQRSFRYNGSELVELVPGEAGRLLGFQVSPDDLGRGIRSFRQGMGELPARLALRLGSQIELRLQHAVERVAPEPRGVGLVDAFGQSSSYDAVVVATTARTAATLLGGALGSTALDLQNSSLLSSLTVTLAYRREDIAHHLDGTGFIVPQPDLLEGVRAVTFSSSKLPHRAPAGYVSLRLFFRPSAHELAALSDTAWRQRGERAIATALSARAPSLRAFVSRWPDALPVFDTAHRARVSALEAELRRIPSPILLAGAAFHGSGIDAAIRSAESAAQTLGSFG